MNKFRVILFVLLISNCLFSFAQKAEKRKVPDGGALLRIEIQPEGDTLYIAPIQDLYVYPRQSYSKASATQEQFYWRTVRDVKKTLPLAKTVAEEIARTNRILAALKTDKERRQYLDAFENQVITQYKPVIENMTRSQGAILLKLIDRQCQITSYDLIRMYKSSISAFFWQGIARIFGANLKVEYDPEGADKQLERIVQLVEAGQL